MPYAGQRLIAQAHILALVTRQVASFRIGVHHGHGAPLRRVYRTEGDSEVCVQEINALLKGVDTFSAFVSF